MSHWPVPLAAYNLTYFVELELSEINFAFVLVKVKSPVDLSSFALAAEFVRRTKSTLCNVPNVPSLIICIPEVPWTPQVIWPALLDILPVTVNAPVISTPVLLKVPTKELEVPP